MLKDFLFAAFFRQSRRREGELPFGPDGPFPNRCEGGEVRVIGWLRRVEGKTGSEELLGHAGEDCPPWITRRHADDDPSDALLHLGADAEQADADRVGLGGGEFGVGERRVAEVFDQDVRGGREQDAELIRNEVVTTGAVGEEAELLFFDAVLTCLLANGGRSFWANG